MMAGETLCAFQSLIDIEVDPVEPAVLAVCTINGGTAFNVIINKFPVY